MITRNEIINFLKDFAIKKDYVYAMWLEGADGINKVDEYSDIDFWFDVEEDMKVPFLYDCISELEKLGKIDSRVDDIRDEIAQSNIHLENTSKYLTLDICVQSHNRDRKFTCYIENDIAELPLVIFDKDNVITYKKSYELDLNEIKEVFANNKHRILQMSRVKKYVERKQYLEAFMKYMENIAYPLVTIARLIYTPRHYEYELCHISNHLPTEIVTELEQFFAVKDLFDIEAKINKVIDVLKRYETLINEKYQIF